MSANTRDGYAWRIFSQFNGKNLGDLAHAEQLDISEAYSALKIWSRTDGVLFILWNEFQRSNDLGARLGAWFSARPELARSLPEDLRARVAGRVLDPAALSDARPRPAPGAASPKAHPQTDHGPRDQEDEAAASATPRLDPWNHPILIAALLDILRDVMVDCSAAKEGQA